MKYAMTFISRFGTIVSTVMCLIPAFAQAQATTPTTKDKEATQLETVEVTGSRLRRVDAETALPVTTISREEIERSGVQNIEQLISYISSADSAGASKTSDLAGLGTFGQSSVSLRGLGDVRTLVLLNGRRVSVFAGTGGGVDIQSIPLAAIERVEVLRDGASTAYGTDAVAGVINFIMRKDYNGAGLSTDQGSPTRKGGGGNGRVNVILGDSGAGDGKVSYLLTGEVAKERALFARDRSFSSTGNNFPYYVSGATPEGRIEGQWNIGSSRATNAALPYGYRSSGYGNPNAPWPGPGGTPNPYAFDTSAAPGYHSDDQCPAINMFFSGRGGRDINGDTQGDFNNCNFDSAPFVGLFPENERYTAFGSFNAQITSDMAFYAEGSFTRNQITEAYQPAPDRVAFMQTDNAFTGSGVDPAILIQPTNPNYPTQYLTAIGAPTNTPYAVTLRAFLAGPRTEQDTNTSYRFVNGLKGNFSFAKDWTYDFSAMYNQNLTAGALIDGYFSQLELARVLNNDPTVKNLWNPWAPMGTQPAAVTAALQSTKYKGPTISASSRLASVEGTTTTGLFEMAGGQSQIAIGGTARREYYKVDVPAILGSGDIAGLGGATLPEDGSRTVDAVYSELNLPVLQPLEINVAARYDHYSDVGGTTNGKLAMRYQPIKEVLFRAAAGTGFRAPTLVELFQPVSLGTSEQFVDPNDPGSGAVQVNAIIGGNQNLKPEKSKQVNLGTVISPLNDLSFGADYFWINIDKYITAPSALGLVVAAEAGTPLYGPNDVTFNTPGDPNSGVDTVNQVNRNAAKATVDGIDAFVGYKLLLGGLGKLGFDFNGTYMHKYDLETLAGVQHSVGAIVDDNGNPLDVAGLGVVPRWKHVASLGWTTGWVTTSLTQNYYAKYRDANDLNGNRHDVPAQSLFDAQVGVKVPLASKHEVALSVGARNLFDKEPPVFIGNGSSFQFGYDPTMYDPRGRFLYVRVGYSFL